MPNVGGPRNEHVCVCGWKTHYWHSMVHHRAGCDSYKEHEGLRRASADKPAAGAMVIDWTCIHDECSDGGSAPDGLGLHRHLKHCKHAIASEKIAEEELAAGLGDVSGDLDKLVAYDAWCRENGREP